MQHYFPNNLKENVIFYCIKSFQKISFRFYILIWSAIFFQQFPIKNFFFIWCTISDFCLLMIYRKYMPYSISLPI